MPRAISTKAKSRATPRKKTTSAKKECASESRLVKPRTSARKASVSKSSAAKKRTGARSKSSAVKKRTGTRNASVSESSAVKKRTSAKKASVSKSSAVKKRTSAKKASVSKSSAAKKTTSARSKSSAAKKRTRATSKSSAVKKRKAGSKSKTVKTGKTPRMPKSPTAARPKSAETTASPSFSFQKQKFLTMFCDEDPDDGPPRKKPRKNTPVAQKQDLKSQLEHARANLTKKKVKLKAANYKKEQVSKYLQMSDEDEDEDIPSILLAEEYSESSELALPAIEYKIRTRDELDEDAVVALVKELDNDIQRLISNEFHTSKSEWWNRATQIQRKFAAADDQIGDFLDKELEIVALHLLEKYVPIAEDTLYVDCVLGHYVRLQVHMREYKVDEEGAENLLKSKYDTSVGTKTRSQLRKVHQG